MKLDDLFNEYKKYTGDKTEYTASGFSRKFKESFLKYGLEQYFSLIKPKNKENFSKDTAYTFTEEEVEKLGYFLGCATSRHTRSTGNYDDVTMFNPFLHSHNREGASLTDLDNFTKKCMRDGREVIDFRAFFEAPKIIELIKFTKDLKKCMKRLIIAIFYMKRLNKNTFSRIISKLNGFVDELYLLGGTKDSLESDILYADEEEELYRSIDVLVAADMCDFIYNSRTDQKGSYSPLIRNTDISTLFVEDEKDYRESLEDTISEIYKNYVELLAEGYEDVEICQKYQKELGVDLTVHSVEARIFKEFIFAEGQNVFEGRIEMNEAIKNTYKEVMDIISEAEKKANERSTEAELIDNALDKLLFKPFIQFHEEDLELLNKRIEENSEVLPEKK